MPKLVFLLSCEKSIIEQDTRSVSLIGLMNSVKVSSPETPPENAVIFKEWSVVSAWDGDEGDDNKDFAQGLDVFFPDGKLFVTNHYVPFKVEKGKRHHIATKLQGFPVGQIGRCQVQVWVESAGKAITEKSSIYIEVEHTAVQKKPEVRPDQQ